MRLLFTCWSHGLAAQVPLGTNLRKTAAMFVRERQLATWVHEQSNSKGIAVPNKLLVTEYGKLVRSSGCAKPGVWETGNSNRRRAWAI